MTWMVAAMTTMTGHGWPSGPDGHGHNVASDAVAKAGCAVDAPAWTVVVTIVLVAGLVAATVAWIPAARRAPDRLPVPVAASPAGPVPPQRIGETATWLTGYRWTATCHALMSAGMAVMLITMI